MRLVCDYEALAQQVFNEEAPTPVRVAFITRAASHNVSACLPTMGGVESFLKNVGGRGMLGYQSSVYKLVQLTPPPTITEEGTPFP